MFRGVASVAASAACVALLCVPAAHAQVQPFGTSDYGAFATSCRPTRFIPPRVPAGPATSNATVRSSSRAIGAITQPLIEWVNRPTFQQADEIQGHAGG
jgi:hypothetical protein